MFMKLGERKRWFPKSRSHIQWKYTEYKSFAYKIPKKNNQKNKNHDDTEIEIK